MAGGTIFGLALLAALTVLGNYKPFVIANNPFIVWSAILMLYCFIASVAPVQLLLQPRDYLSAYLLIIGVALGYAGLFISHPTINAPIFTSFGSHEGFIWPMLFVTVACGAVSGFHSLIASGTTSKQLASEGHAKRVGYGAMVAEGIVAVLALLAVTAGLRNGDAFAELMRNGGPIAAFGAGFGELTKKLLRGHGSLIAIMILNAFILTTLDTATRIGRYLTHELTGIKNRYAATFIVVALAGYLALSGHWNVLWPVFGAANQLIAALALLVISCWLLSRGKSARVAFIPAILMLITTFGALVYQAFRFLKARDYLLGCVSVALIFLAGFVLLETIAVFKKRRVRSNEDVSYGTSEATKCPPQR